MGTTRLPLSRDRILGRAVQIADAEGVEALTMRRLADELGFEAMSLYRHVKNKDDVLGGMLDLVLAEIESPAAPGAWESLHTVSPRIELPPRYATAACGVNATPSAARLNVFIPVLGEYS